MEHIGIGRADPRCLVERAAIYRTGQVYLWIHVADQARSWFVVIGWTNGTHWHRSCRPEMSG